MPFIVAVLFPHLRGALKTGGLTVLFSGWVLFAPLASAQSGGTIVGTVADETGGVLPGVTVDLHSDGMETTVVTSETGTYRIDDVPAGPAELTFKLINFTIVRRTLNVTAGQTATADAVLGLSLTADIVVTAARTFSLLTSVPVGRSTRAMTTSSSACRRMVSSTAWSISTSLEDARASARTGAPSRAAC